MLPSLRKDATWRPPNRGDAQGKVSGLGSHCALSGYTALQRLDMFSTEALCNPRCRLFVAASSPGMTKSLVVNLQVPVPRRSGVGTESTNADIAGLVPVTTFIILDFLQELGVKKYKYCIFRYSISYQLGNYKNFRSRLPGKGTEILNISIIFIILLLLQHLYGTMHVKRSEDNFVKSFLSFHLYMGSRDQI